MKNIAYRFGATLLLAVAYLLAGVIASTIYAGRVAKHCAKLLAVTLFVAHWNSRSPFVPRLQVMGVAQTIPLLPFTNVVASGIAICDLQNLFGYTLERVILNLGGTTFTKSMITLAQLKANGKVIWESTGSATDSRQQYRGIAASANFLTIDFLELKARTKMGLMGGGLDTTLGIKNLRLEVTIAGATAPTLAGTAEVSIPQTTPEYAQLRPLIARVHRTTVSIGGAGTFLLPVPHFDPNAGGSIYKRIAVLSANMTGGRIERNGIREWDISVKALNDFNQAEYGRVGQAGLWMFDFVVDGLQEDRVLDTRPASGTNTASCYGTFSGAETITIEAEVLEPLDVY